MMTSDVGIGIRWLWMLPKTHPFHYAAADHDAAYDAWYVHTEKKTLLEIPEEPSYYLGSVESYVKKITEHGYKKRDWFKMVDNLFYITVKGIANTNNSLSLKLQARLFYILVRGWSFLI